MYHNIKIINVCWHFRHFFISLDGNPKKCPKKMFKIIIVIENIKLIFCCDHKNQICSQN